MGLVEDEQKGKNGKWKYPSSGLLCIFGPHVKSLVRRIQRALTTPRLLFSPSKSDVTFDRDLLTSSYSLRLSVFLQSSSILPLLFLIISFYSSKWNHQKMSMNRMETVAVNLQGVFRGTSHFSSFSSRNSLQIFTESFIKLTFQ